MLHSRWGPTFVAPQAHTAVKQHNTKRFTVIRNDKVVYDRGGTSAYNVFSASKGLMGAPDLVYAMSRCGVNLADRASRWLGHADGARWETDYPWNDITVEHLFHSATLVSTYCRCGDIRHICEYRGVSRLGSSDGLGHAPHPPGVRPELLPIR